MKSSRTRRKLAVLAIISIALTGIVAIGADTNRKLLPFQGRLTDANSVPVSGTHDLTFSLYTEPDAEYPKWTESHIGLAVTDGRFSVVLGRIYSFDDPCTSDAVSFAEPLYMGITVTGDANEMRPRKQVVPALYAHDANFATYAGEALNLKGVVHVEDGNVGIGTFSPTAKLDVAGNVAISDNVAISGNATIEGKVTGELLQVSHDGAAADLVVDANGNVGIGTENPAAKLEIVGNFKTSGIYEAADGKVGIGTTDPEDKLHVEGTVKANKFNGVPWRSPVWYIQDAGANDIAYFPSVAWDQHYLGRYYRLPYNVIIDGAVVSVSDDGPDAYVSIDLMRGSSITTIIEYRTTEVADFSGNFDSRNVPFTTTSCTVSKGYLIGARCATGNNPEVFIFFYGRIQE